MIAPCSPCVGSTAVTKPRPSCWAMTEPATSSAEMVSRAVIPSVAPIKISWTSMTSRRPKRARVDVIGAAVQRQQHGGEHERECQPHPRRQVLLAEPRQQHQHGAGAREHQKKRRRQRRQK